jgi:hypothetical protein
MKTALPPWQLTTSELEREISALESSPDGRPPRAGSPVRRRLGALDAERDGRMRLAARLAKVARQHPDDEPW